MPESPRVNASLPLDEFTCLPTFFVATVFEDEVAADCARQLMSRILQMAGHTEPVQEYACGLHLFDQPDGPAATARRVGSADVLVVATHRDSPALGRVADWLTHWLAPQRTKQGALVAVTIDPPEASLKPSLNEERLSSIAAQIEMKFFSTHILAVTEFTADAPSIPPKER